MTFHAPQTLQSRAVFLVGRLACGLDLCWACMNHVPQVIGINKCCLDGHIKLHSNLVSCECYYCPLLVSTTNLPSLITLLQHS